jgi:aspartyl-tRNA(Asn)/glutamyl-tRNA(Gln) amidotransferase subunit C
MADDRGEFNIAHVAGLARLALTPDQETLFQKQLADVLAWAADVLAVPTDGVPPMTQIGGDHAPARADLIVPSLSGPDALRNAPDPAGAALLFRVPKVIG